MRPKFIDCLGETRNIFEVRLGGFIKSTCIYHGIPVPSLRCVLLDENDQPLRSTIPEIVATNYTAKRPMILADVQITVNSVRCTAFQSKTITAVRRRYVFVLGKFHGILHCFLFVFISENVASSWIFLFYLVRDKFIQIILIVFHAPMSSDTEKTPSPIRNYRRLLFAVSTKSHPSGLGAARVWVGFRAYHDEVGPV